MLRGPCKGCPDKTPGCHSNCEKYIAYRICLDALREQEAQEKKLKEDLYLSSRQSKAYEKRRRESYANSRYRH